MAREISLSLSLSLPVPSPLDVPTASVCLCACVRACVWARARVRVFFNLKCLSNSSLYEFIRYSIALSAGGVIRHVTE